MDAIREDVSVLTVLSEVLCLLDMMVNSFAHTISTKPVDRYTRARFTCEYLVITLNTFLMPRLWINWVVNFSPLEGDGPLAIDSGRHPILESIHNDFIVCCFLLMISVEVWNLCPHSKLMAFLYFDTGNFWIWTWHWILFCSQMASFFLKHQIWLL